jgi:flagellar biosynthesis protein FlhB
MAEGDDDTDKTEDPTQKRLEDALKRGDVVKSQEINTWFVIAASALILLSFANSMGSQFNAMFRGIIANAYRIPADGGGLLRLFQQVGVESLAVCAVPFLLLTLAAIAGNMIQHRMVWSAESLAPKFSKISPMAGAKRMFSKQALANFVKGLLKLTVVGAVLAALMWPERNRLEGLIGADIVAVLPFTRTLSLQLMGSVVAILAIVAAVDYLFQYHQWYERQKMSLREMKEEFRQSEGDPKIKQKIRQLRYNRSRKRMMAAVPQATVVVTNPTHFAVALKYERGMNAPICVAKGADLIALKIREVAKANDVPVIENPPLARALHATVEIDQEVPPEQYKACAEIIGYVMRLNRSLRS